MEVDDEHCCWLARWDCWAWLDAVVPPTTVSIWAPAPITLCSKVSTRFHSPVPPVHKPSLRLRGASQLMATGTLRPRWKTSLLRVRAVDPAPKTRVSLERMRLEPITAETRSSKEFLDVPPGN